VLQPSIQKAFDESDISALSTADLSHLADGERKQVQQLPARYRQTRDYLLGRIRQMTLESSGVAPSALGYKKAGLPASIAALTGGSTSLRKVLAAVTGQAVTGEEAQAKATASTEASNADIEAATSSREEVESAADGGGIVIPDIPPANWQGRKGLPWTFHP
jgi:hypothetical protein